MGQTVYALIEHSLTPEEILELPKKLETCSNNELAGKWNWSCPNFDANALLKIWNTTNAEFLTKSSWGEEDFPWLEKDDFTLNFFTPNLIAFNHRSKWFFFRNNEVRIGEFSKLTRAIGELVNASDLLFVPEITDDFVNAHENLTVDLFRQCTKKSKDMDAIEVR